MRKMRGKMVGLRKGIEGLGNEWIEHHTQSEWIDMRRMLSGIVGALSMLHKTRLRVHGHVWEGL
jgi:hypothetical protein